MISRSPSGLHHRGAPALCARARPVARYVLGMADEQDTEELKLTQLEREAAERRRARSAPDEGETAQHERRADKAHYLRKKLEERAESERRRKG